jgi:CubicO group peptidase (beta-lactamase class C family)
MGIKGTMTPIRVGLVLAVLARAASAQTTVVVDGPEGARLDSIIRAAEAAGFHGNVLISLRGRTVLLKGYGIADPTAGTRFTPGTVVQIGSNTKDFTKVAIFQLIERGQLAVTDSLGRFFPALPADKRAITIRQLLDHTAGLPLGVSGDANALTKDELLRRVAALTLESGGHERYSNAGYSMLAAIVEQLSGQTFDAYLDANVFRPAGMRETGLLIPRFAPARIAHGVEANGTSIGTIMRMPRDADGHLWSLRGNGGLLSTLSDMQRFYRAVRSPTLLRDAMHRREVLGEEGPNVLSGSDLVSMFMFGNYPGPQAEIIIASNHAGYMANRLLPALQLAVGVRAPGLDDPRGVVIEGPRAERRPGANAGQQRLPDNGAGRTIQAYVDAFNSGDTVVMRRFYETRMAPNPNAPPMEARLARYQTMRSNLGRLTLRSVREAPDGMGTAVDFESETGENVTITFDVEPDAPFRLRGLRVEVG